MQRYRIWNSIYEIVYSISWDIAESNSDIRLTILYKLLVYVIEEITNAIKKTYIRSRTALEVTNPDALGVIDIKNYENFIK